jgi:hypothetical protein
MPENKNLRKISTYTISDWSAERKFYGRFYQSQGFFNKNKITNDCGPASLASILNVFLFQDNLNNPPLEKEMVIRSLGFTFWNRLPKWMPRVGGATAPWGMVTAFNHWSKKYNLKWKAERRSNSRRAHILENLLLGKPVSALKIWRTGGAHWINLVRYSSEKERLYFLDPNPYLQFLPEEKRLQSQTWEEFNLDWTRTNWWSKLLGIKKELITYSKLEK